MTTRSVGRPAHRPHAATARPEDQLRSRVWTAIEQTGTTQRALAAAVGHTPKHINQVLRGHVRLNADLAAEMLEVMGWELVIAVRPIRRTAV